MGKPSQNYGVSLALWDHTMLLATWHKWTHPTLTPAILAQIFGQDVAV